METPAQLAKVLAELASREPIFHRPEFGTMPEDFDHMMAPEFWEIGASGNRYTREDVLDELKKRHAASHNDVWETSEFQCQQLAPELYLLHYTLLQDGTRRTRRTTIWRRVGSSWQVVFHQGTMAPDK